MKKFRHYRGFTLIELLIVIAIIAILAAIIVVSYANAQKKSRDNKRKADVQSIASAYQIHFQETKRWYFDTAEVRKINSTVPDGTREGSGGRGWFNLENGSSYLVSMAHALSGLNYMTDPPKSPKGADYMKYFCNIGGSTVGIVVTASLEDPAAISSPYSEMNDSQFQLCEWSTDNLATTLNTLYGMNYAVIMK